MNCELRTPKQSDCLHLWIRQVAQALNEEGITQQPVIKALQERGLDIPWTEGSVKANIWKPVQLAMIGQESTTQAGRTDYNAEYMGLCKLFAQEFGIVLPPWPDRFSRASSADR